MFQMERDEDGHLIVLHIHHADGMCFRLEGNVRFIDEDQARHEGAALLSMMRSTMGVMSPPQPLDKDKAC